MLSKVIQVDWWTPNPPSLQSLGIPTRARPCSNPYEQIQSRLREGTHLPDADQTGYNETVGDAKRSVPHGVGNGMTLYDCSPQHHLIDPHISETSLVG